MKELINKIINDDAVIDTFCNLYMRWQDEKYYENINDYGNVMLTAIKNLAKEVNVNLIATTQKPFGIKTTINGKILHFFVKKKGNYLCVCARLQN